MAARAAASCVDGYKRHVLRDLDSGLVRAVGLTRGQCARGQCHRRASRPTWPPSRRRWRELHIDRAYLSSTLVRERPPDAGHLLQSLAGAQRRPLRQDGLHAGLGARAAHAVRSQVSVPFAPGGTVHFPARGLCGLPAAGALHRPAAQGRSVHIHPDERLLAELRARQQTPAGRAKLRERVAVEHTLAHIGRWQGDRARYRGLRKNLFDLRRVAVVHNLHVLARLPDVPQAA